MRISILQKLGLVVLGIFLFFVVLEVALNIGGFVFSALREYRKDLSFKQKDVYRILALGESTTADGMEDSYPSQLESILNQRKLGIEFSVLNDGVPGADSAYILSRLKANLDRYNPDMVIVMMGINDLGNHIPRENNSNSKVMLLLRRLKTYKLTRFMWLRIITKINEKNGDNRKLDEGHAEEVNFSMAEYKLKKATELNPNDDVYVALGRLYSEYYRSIEIFNNTSKIDEVANQKNDLAYIGYGCVYLNKNNMIAAKSSFLKALELNPRNDFAYIGLGCVYMNKNATFAAETSFLKALKINPKNSFAYIELAWLFEEQGRLLDAEELLKKAIDVDPYDDTAYVELGWLLMLRGDSAYAEELLKKARYLYPYNFGAIKYLELIKNKINSVKLINKMLTLSRRKKWEYIELNKFRKLIMANKISLAEESFKKAIVLNERNSYAYFELYKIYKDKGKILEAEEVLKKAIELNPGEFLFYSKLGWQFVMDEDFVKAEELFKKAVEVNPNNDKAWGLW
ncbi:MAG: tetratricopeptide repeat protein [Candidatus Omnitrophota bacterium]